MAHCDPLIDEEHEAEEALPYVVPINVKPFQDELDGLVSWKRTTLCKKHLADWRKDYRSPKPAKGHPDYKPRRKRRGE